MRIGAERQGFRLKPELESVLAANPGWLDVNIIESNVAYAPKTMVQVCEAKIAEAKFKLMSESESMKFSTVLFPKDVKEAFDFVKRTLLSLKNLLISLENSQADNTLSNKFSVNGSVRKVEIELTKSNLRKQGVGTIELARNVHDLEISLIITQAMSEDPEVSKVPMKFARAVCFLLPEAKRPIIRGQLVEVIYNADMSAAFSEQEKKLLIIDLSPRGQVDIKVCARHPELISRLFFFAQYSSRGPLGYADNNPETFENFMRMKKLQNAIRRAVDQTPGIEAELGRDLLQVCCSREYDIYACAKSILSVLRQRTDGVNSTTFLYALMRNLAPFIGCDWEKINQYRFLSDGIRQKFCVVFEKKFLTSNLEDASPGSHLDL